jgi:hypothetical protein
MLNEHANFYYTHADILPGATLFEDDVRMVSLAHGFDHCIAVHRKSFARKKATLSLLN